MITKIKTLEKAINEFTNFFIKKYYGDDISELFWISDCVGGVLVANDQFFSLDDMMEFVRCGYSPDEMFRYYDYRFKRQSGDKFAEIISQYKKKNLKKK
jgi:hypothetical protein